MIFNKKSGLLLTNGSYKYLLHNTKLMNREESKNYIPSDLDHKFLVTGASGGLEEKFYLI